MPHHTPRLWDISPPVDAHTPAFPGDTPYSQTWVATLGPGCPVNVSAITLSPHLGAHADAPLHYDPAGQAVGALDLAPFLGPCRVIHAINPGPLVLPHHLATALNRPAPLPPRVLVRTYTHMPQSQWDGALSAFAPDTVELLGAERLVHARLGEEILTLRLDESVAPPQAGQSFHATPRADRLHWFDAQTQKRIA